MMTIQYKMAQKRINEKAHQSISNSLVYTNKKIQRSEVYVGICK